MFRIDYVVALALLTGPADAPERPIPAGDFQLLAPALQAVAIDWEVLDPREVRHMLAQREEFGADVNLLRRRCRDLADAPPLDDCLRFPQRETINELLAFNRAYRQQIGIRQPVEIGRSEELRAALQEADHLYQVWDTARDARCEYYYITVRRQALKKLRDLVGDVTYSSGRLPPHVPLWRFQEIN